TGRSVHAAKYPCTEAEKTPLSARSRRHNFAVHFSEQKNARSIVAGQKGINESCATYTRGIELAIGFPFVLSTARWPFMTAEIVLAALQSVKLAKPTPLI